MNLRVWSAPRCARIQLDAVGSPQEVHRKSNGKALVERPEAPAAPEVEDAPGGRATQPESEEEEQAQQPALAERDDDVIAGNDTTLDNLMAAPLASQADSAKVRRSRFLNTWL